MRAIDLLNDNLVIIGAGGHGRVCAEIASLMGYQKIVFLDDCLKGNGAVVGKTQDIPLYLRGYDYFVGLGSNTLRKTFYERIKVLGGTVATLIHPNSIISKTAVIGEGSVVMAGAVVNPGAELGRGVIVNTCSSADHDCRLKDFCHIGVGAHLAGTVEIGETSFIGAGTAIINNIMIGDGITVGAGAAVVRDLTEAGTYVGVPARKIK